MLDVERLHQIGRVNIDIDAGRVFMIGPSRTNRHTAPTDPMMTNSYLIRATIIRDKALADADQREQLAKLGVTPIPTRLHARFIALTRRIRLPRLLDFSTESEATPSAARLLAQVRLRPLPARLP